jgi:DNA-binding NtrC family response regulator
LAYNWPGNVRELEECIKAAVARDKEVLFSWDVNLKNQPAESQREEGQDSEKAGEQVGESQKPKRMDEFEKEKIMEVLGHTGGNLTKAHELLGFARQTLLNKMDKYGIPRNYGKS